MRKKTKPQTVYIGRSERLKGNTPNDNWGSLHCGNVGDFTILLFLLFFLYFINLSKNTMLK